MSLSRTNAGTALTGLPCRLLVLVVDDHLFDQTRLQRLLAFLEIDTEVLKATSSDSMRMYLEDDTFDMILPDCQMPDGNGLKALEVVQSSHLNRHAATVMVSEDGQTGIGM